MQNTSPHFCKQRQDTLESNALTAGEYTDIASICAMTATRYRAIDSRPTGGNNRRAQTLDLGFIRGRHLKPYFA